MIRDAITAPSTSPSLPTSLPSHRSFFVPPFFVQASHFLLRLPLSESLHTLIVFYDKKLDPDTTRACSLFTKFAAIILSHYFTVAAYVVITYDWALTFGQEVELIVRKRWSLMTILYLTLRYGGIFYAVIRISFAVPTFSTTDAVSLVINDTLVWMNDVVNVILSVIMIARLHAMYLQSRKVLIFLVINFLAIRIANAAMIAVITTKISGEEFVLSGTYQCMIGYEGDSLFLASMTWVLATIWEVLALCLAVWIAVKHFRELRRRSTRSIIGDCFAVLIQTHISYFVSFVIVSSLEMSHFSPMLWTNGNSLEDQIYDGFVQIVQSIQVFVLGPRLILSIREYHAELVADSDTATVMTSIAFQEHVYVSTSSSV